MWQSFVKWHKAEPDAFLELWIFPGEGGLQVTCWSIRRDKEAERQLERLMKLAFSFVDISFSFSVLFIWIRPLCRYCNNMFCLKLKWQSQRLVKLGAWVVIGIVAYMHFMLVFQILRWSISYMSFTCELVINYFLLSIFVCNGGLLFYLILLFMIGFVWMGELDINYFLLSISVWNQLCWPGFIKHKHHYCKSRVNQ